MSVCEWKSVTLNMLYKCMCAIHALAPLIKPLKVRKQHLLIYGITYDTLALHNYCCSCLFFVCTGKHQFPPQEKKKVSITGCMDL